MKQLAGYSPRRLSIENLLLLKKIEEKEVLVRSGVKFTNWFDPNIYFLVLPVSDGISWFNII